METISGIYSKVLTRTYSTGGMKGRLTGVSVGNVPAASYSYDAVGRISGINNISFGYLANSNLLSTAARPNNVNTTWSYEADRDLVTSVENKLNSAVISKYAYTNDAIGRRTAMARSGSVFSAADTLSYLYNDRSEVTGANSNAAGSLYHYAYSFDNIGNRLAANLAGTPWTYTANNLNQYSAFTKNQVAETPSYDDDGNMLTCDGWVQIWNAENRLIKAEKGTAKLEFAYDYMGRRIFKKVFNGNTLTSHTRFVYDGYKLMEELDALNNNAVLRRYAWSPTGLDVPVSVYDAAANSTYYYHTDANKNITELTNASGSVVAHYEYSPFGKVVVSTGTYAGTNPFRFSSEYHDDETGLVYYNYRYYSPELGRWLSKDPIGEEGGVNLFIYVCNGVTNYTDHIGLKKYKKIYIIANDKDKAYYVARFWYLFSAVDVNEIEDIRKDIEKTVNGEVDRTGRCGNCISSMVIIGHGYYEQITLGEDTLTYGDFKDIEQRNMSKEKNKNKKRIITSGEKFLTLKEYLCTDAYLEIRACFVGQKNEEEDNDFPELLRSLLNIKDVKMYKGEVTPQGFTSPGTKNKAKAKRK